MSSLPSYGRTPLFVAAMRGEVSQVRRLLQTTDAASDLHRRDQNGDTALLKAATNGCTECVRLLVQAGADLAAKDATGTSGLLLACQFDEVDTVGFLWPLQRRRYPATLRNAEGHTPLMVACIFGNATTAERLLRRGEEEEQDDQPSDPEESDECGKTALIHASMRGNLDCVRLLLSRGADLEHGDSDGDTPLIWAAWQGQTRCVEILLDAQPPAKIDHQDEAGYTALMNAVRWCHTACVRVLLAHGADVSLSSSNGSTAWSLAVCADQPDAALIDWLQDAAKAKSDTPPVTMTTTTTG